VRKPLKIFGILVIIVVLFLAWRLFFRFLPIIPHERITISLPFVPSDDPHLFSINPMGETVNHPKPQNPHGHPGVDFLWDKNVEIISVAPGEVTRIEIHKGGPSGGKSYDVDVSTGIYAVRYTELTSYRKDLKVGSKLKQGEFIGYPFYEKHSDGKDAYSIHWEFDYDTVWYDRICPLTYFDESSRSRIDSLWLKVGWTHDGKFPHFCSGDYFGRDK